MDFPFLFLTTFHERICNIIFKASNLKDEPDDLIGNVYADVKQGIYNVVEFLLPVAAEFAGHELPGPNERPPFWAGKVVWEYVLHRYNAPRAKVCFCTCGRRPSYADYIRHEG